MHQSRARKTDGLPGQTFDTCPEGHVLAFDLLCMLFPHGMCARIEMTAIGPPAIRVKVCDTKWRS